MGLPKACNDTLKDFKTLVNHSASRNTEHSLCSRVAQRCWGATIYATTRRWKTGRTSGRFTTRRSSTRRSSESSAKTNSFKMWLAQNCISGRPILMMGLPLKGMRPGGIYLSTGLSAGSNNPQREYTRHLFAKIARPSRTGLAWGCCREPISIKSYSSSQTTGGTRGGTSVVPVGLFLCFYAVWKRSTSRATEQPPPPQQRATTALHSD